MLSFANNIIVSVTQTEEEVKTESRRSSIVEKKVTAEKVRKHILRDVHFVVVLTFCVVLVE